MKSTFKIPVFALLLMAVNILLINCTRLVDSPPGASFYNCSDEPFSGVSVEEFRIAVAKYNRTRSAIINPTLPGNILDARACWFALDTLKKFICHIEELSNSLNLTAEDLGIRFYYGVYPHDGPVHGDYNYRDRHTLFMVATYKDTLNSVLQNIDFDPRQSSLHNFITINKLIANDSLHRKGKMFAMGGLNFTDPNMIENQGQLCPPACPPQVENFLSRVDASRYDEDEN